MHRPRILVVDDEVDLALAMRDVLQRSFSADVAVATDGDEAWRLLEAGQHFDVVLAEAGIPGLDGAMLLSRWAARDPATSRVLLSLAAHEGLAASTRAHLFVRKPFGARQLVEDLVRLGLRPYVGTEEPVEPR